MMLRRWSGLIVLLSLVHVAHGQEAQLPRCHGRVVDAAGKPVAGATVRMLSHGLGAEENGYLVDQATTTDAEGRFDWPVPKRWLRMSLDRRQELGVVAVHEGRIAAIVIARNSLPPRAGLTLQFFQPAETTVVVRSLQGTPVRAAKVKIIALQVDHLHADLTEEEAKLYAGQLTPTKVPNGYVLGRSLLSLPEELHRVAGTTDDMGRVTFSTVAAGRIGAVHVDSAEFGSQYVMQFVWRGQRQVAGWPGTITLQPVGRVRGRLSGPAGPVANREVTVGSHGKSTEELFHGGSAKTHTDAEGRFEVAHLAAGTLQVQVKSDPKAPEWVIDSDKLGELKPGGTAELNVSIKPAVRVTGVVLNAQTKKPVPDVYVYAWSGQPSQSLTDAAGRFAVWAAPGKAYVFPFEPEGFLRSDPPDKWGKSYVPEPIEVKGTSMELAPLLIEPEATLRGVVVDERGEPIPKASVSAISLVFDHRKGYPHHREVQVQADERGEFAVAGIDPRVEIRLRAQGNGASRVVTVAKPGKEPVRIAMAKDVFRLQGHVVDAKGKDVADATLELWHRDWRPPPTEAEPKKVALQETIRTDKAGKFATPPLLADGLYRFVIRGAGVKTTESPWLDATVPAAAQAQELVVTRLAGRTGVVRDRQGKPVAEAQVTLLSREVRVETASDGRGEFTLETPAGKPFAVVVRHPEFRAHGRHYEKDPAELDQVLTRLSEPANKCLPQTILCAEQRKQLLQQLLTAYKEKVLKSATMQDKLRTGEVLARVDPEAWLEHLDKNPLKPAMMHDSALQFLVKHWASRRPEDAAELIGKMEASYVKAMALCELADGATDKAKKREALAEALVQARAEKAPELRTILLGFVGRRLVEVGDQDQAAIVLREGAKLAGGLSTGAFAGYARGQFATDLAVLELPAALALVKDLKDPREFRRHHGNIAHRIAGKDPAAAVKILDLIPGPAANEFNQRDQYAIRVCYRMAAVDLPRARQLAESILDVPSRAQAFGVMAQAVARKEPKIAVDLLRRACTLLEEDAARPDPSQLTSALTAGSVAAILLFYAEQVDATLVEECMWRAFALQRAPTEDPQRQWRYQTTNNALAMSMARYDAKLAELLLPVPSPQFSGREGQLAQFLLHPQRTALAAGKASTPKEVQELLQLISYLGTEEEQLPRLIHRTLGIWRIDAEDIDF